MWLQSPPAQKGKDDEVKETPHSTQTSQRRLGAALPVCWHWEFTAGKEATGNLHCLHWPGQVCCADSEVELTPTGAPLTQEIVLLQSSRGHSIHYTGLGNCKAIMESSRWEKPSDQVQTFTQHCQKSISSDPASPRNKITNPNGTSKNTSVFLWNTKQDQFSLNSFPVLEAEYCWWVLQRFHRAAQIPGGPFQLRKSWDSLKYQPLGNITRRKNRSRCPAQKDTWSCRSSPEAEKELTKLMRTKIHPHSSRKFEGPPCELYWARTAKNSEWPHNNDPSERQEQL